MGTVADLVEEREDIPALGLALQGDCPVTVLRALIMVAGVVVTVSARVSA